MDVKGIGDFFKQLIPAALSNKKSKEAEVAKQLLQESATPTPKDVKKTVMAHIAAAKTAERKALAQSMFDAYKKINSTKRREIDLSADTLLENGVERIVARFCKGQPPSDALKQALIKEIRTTGKIDIQAILGRCGIEAEPRQVEVLRLQVAQLKKGNDRFTENYQKMRADASKLEKLLIIEPDEIRDLHAHNNDILKLKRAILSNPAYQLLKTDETNFIVRLVHNLCLASYADTKASDSYVKFGKEMMEALGVDEGSALHEIIKESYDKAVDAGVPKDNTQLVIEFIGKDRKSCLDQLGKVFHATISNLPVFLDLPRVFHGIFPKEDQRIAYGNNPGLLYSATKTSNGRQVQVDTVYTPGPTVGIEGSPEFCACLQAMENRQFTDVEPDDYPYTGWVYNNLQDITSTIENPQSVGLMRLNDHYPFSFFGATISLDNYMMKGKGDEQRVLDESYRKEFRGLILDEANYSLENRKGTPAGYYFPIQADKRDQWRRDVEKIEQEAYEVVRTVVADPSLPNEVVLSFYRDLVTQGIMAHFENSCIDKQMSASTGTKPVKFLHCQICRSGIDRGGEMNAKQVAAQVKGVQAAYLIQGRSSVTRFRLPIEENLRRVQFYTQAMQHDDGKRVESFLKSAGRVGGTETTGFTLHA